MAQTSISTKKLANTLEIISCCWHESGHALCGLLLHFKIANISLTYAQEVEGTTTYLCIDKAIIDQQVQKQLALNEVKLLYAGMIAEQLYYKDICGSSKLPAVLRDGWQNDVKQASNAIKIHDLASAGKKRQMLKSQAKKEVALLMTEYWDDLRLISHMLYKTKRLSWEDLKKLLTKKSDKREFWKARFQEIEILFSNSIDATKIGDYIYR